ncbi:MAG: ABC transporter permease [Kineosporiaceae bacterium]
MPAGPAPGGERWRAVVPPAAVALLFVGLWYGISYLAFPDPVRRAVLLPPPHQVVEGAFLEPATAAELLGSLWLTTQVALVGLGVAIALGMSTAILMSQARWLERSLFPYAVILQTIPILALVPLLGFWFGFGFTARVIVCVLIALFPIIANTLFGLRSADPGMHDLFPLHGASRWTRLVRLQLPAALPATFAGLRIAAGLSVIGAVVGDFFFAQGRPGIGRLIEVYRSRLLIEEMFGAILLASALGVVVFLLFGWIARRAVGSWHDVGSSGP